MPSLMSHLSSKSDSVRFNAAGCLRCLSFDDDILNAMLDPSYVIDAPAGGECSLHTQHYMSARHIYSSSDL